MKNKTITIKWLDGSGDLLDDSGDYISLSEALALLTQSLHHIPFEEWNGVYLLSKLVEDGYVRIIEHVAIEITPKGLRHLATHYRKLPLQTVDALHAWSKNLRQVREKYSPVLER